MMTFIETIRMFEDFDAGEPNRFGKWTAEQVHAGTMLAIAALTRQKPVTPLFPSKEQKSSEAICPLCGGKAGFCNYCPDCGQRME